MVERFRVYLNIVRTFLKDWIPGQARDDTGIVWCGLIFIRVVVSLMLDSGSQAGMMKYSGAALL